MSNSPRPPRPLASDLSAALGAGDRTAFVTAVDAHLQRSDEAGASVALWQGLARWPRDEHLARRLADALHRTGDGEGMRRLARLVLERRLRAPDLHFAIGVWAEERGEGAAAARSFARAARADLDDSDPVVRLARAYRSEDRPDLAQRVVERALKRLPDAAELHAALGYTLIDAHRPVAAAKCFREALRRAPDWATYREDLASALGLAERWREAAEEAQSCVRTQPQSERGWATLAAALARLGQRELADQAYRKTLQLTGASARTQGNYGLFLASDPARLFEAARHLRAALESYPDWDEVRTSLAQLAG